MKILGEFIDDDPDILIPTDKSTLVFEYCCDCGLRHIVIYDPVSKGDKKYIHRRLWRDDLASKLLRHHDRQKKKKKR